MRIFKTRIAVDIRDLKIAKTGARTYLKELCAEFEKEDQEFEFIFIGGRFQNIIPTNTVVGKIEAMIRFLWWKQVAMPIIAKFKSCEIIFCTDFFVPLFHPGMVTIPVFHDAFFWEYKSHYSKFWQMIFNRLALPAAKKSPYIITPTHYTQQQIAKYSGIATEKIIPVYEAAMRTSKSVAFKMPTNKKYILHVGTFEKRKNLPTLIKAYAQFIKESGLDYDLVLVGQSSSKQFLDDTLAIDNAIRESNLQDNIHKTGYVADEALAQIYQQASLYVFPSFNEGFGIPVIEAFQHKVPVLIANNTCLPEIAADAAISFDPYNSEELYQVMKQVLNDPTLQKSLQEKGLARAKQFSWESAAVSIKSIFKNAVIPYL